MRILITGTNGFIGKNLLNELKDKHDILEINEDIFDIEESIIYANKMASIVVSKRGVSTPFKINSAQNY